MGRGTMRMAQSNYDGRWVRPMNERYVRMKDCGALARAGVIQVLHWSDDGEFIRFKILPNGPEIGMWIPGKEKLLVVNCKTVHENIVKAFPQLYESVEMTMPNP